MADDKVTKMDSATSQSTGVKVDPSPKLIVEAGAGDPADAKRVATDPWGDTPLQMRDVHSPEVDPKHADV